MAIVYPMRREFAVGIKRGRLRKLSFDSQSIMRGDEKMIEVFLLEIVLFIVTHCVFVYGERILNAIFKVRRGKNDENVEKSSCESEK